MTESSNCNRNYVIPSYPICSGHGVCISETNKCKCFEGWSSIADFQLIQGYDCDIHLYTILALACLTLSVATFGICVCISSIYHSALLRNVFEPTKKLLIIYSFLCNFIGLFTASILKVINTEKYVIGSTDQGSTIFIYIALIGSCMGLHLFVNEIVLFLKRSLRFIDYSSIISLDTQLAFYNRYSPLFPWFAASILIVFIAVQVNPLRGDLYVIAFLGMDLLLFLFGGIVVLHTIPVFIDEMKKLIASHPEHTENENIQQLINKLTSAHTSFTLFVYTLAPPHLLFMIWSFMRRKFTYLLWFICLQQAVVSVYICLSVKHRTYRQAQVIPVAPRVSL